MMTSVGMFSFRVVPCGSVGVTMNYIFCGASGRTGVQTRLSSQAKTVLRSEFSNQLCTDGDGRDSSTPQCHTEVLPRSGGNSCSMFPLIALARVFHIHPLHVHRGGLR